MKYRSFQILVVALLLTVPDVSQAQNLPAVGQPFTLADCVRYATTSNTDMRKQNLALLQSSLRVDETRAAVLPQVSASMQAVDNVLIAKQLLPGEIFGQPGTVIPVKFGVQYAVPMKVEASQLVFNKQYSAGLESAKAAEGLAQANAAQVRESVAYNVASAFYSTLVTGEQRNIVEANLDKVSQSVQVAQVQFDNKMIRRIDLDQLRVSQSNTRSELDNVAVAYDQSLDMLKILMGYPLADTLLLVSPLADAPLVSLPENGTAANPLLVLLDRQTNLKNLEIKGIRAQYYPTIGAFINYGYQAQFDKLSSVNWIPSSTIGVSVNVPIFDGFRKERQVDQRKIDLQSIALDRELANNQLNSQYQNARRKYRQNLQTVKNQQSNLELAQNVYAAIQNNYKNGIATLSDLINADTGLRGAQTQFLTAQLQARLSALDVLRANGTASTELTKN